MSDLMITKGRGRFQLRPNSQRGVNYIWRTFHAKDIGPEDVVSFNTEALEEIKEELRRCNIEFDDT